MLVPYSLITQEGEDTAHLYILGDISAEAWMSRDTDPAGLINALAQVQANNIQVHIDSYGGDTSAGISIYNLLRACPKSVTTICEGFGCSAASLIFMAGNRRIMRKSSLLMIHNAWTWASGNADQLEAAAADLRKISDTAANIYRTHVRIDNAQLQRLLDEETWITPEEALAYGFATEVEEDPAPGGQAYSSAFRAIYHAVRGAEENPPAPESTKTPLQRLFGTYHK